MNYTKFLENNYNMKSNITLYNYLQCLNGCVDVYSIDKETNEEYFATLEKEDTQNLTTKEKNYKVIRITSNFIIIYID